MLHDEPRTTADAWCSRRIRVTCRSCGVLRLEAGAVGGRHCLDTGAASYHFTCPTCGLLETQPMDAALLPALRHAGATITEWSLPAELRERPTGAPLGLDDLIDLNLALEAPDWFDRLVAGT
jgi:hypothetical protein